MQAQSRRPQTCLIYVPMIALIFSRVDYVRADNLWCSFLGQNIISRTCLDAVKTVCMHARTVELFRAQYFLGSSLSQLRRCPPCDDAL